MKVVLAGATGALGTILVPHLIAAGHSVLGPTRSPSGARRLREVGAEPVIADVMDSRGLLAALDGHQAEAVHFPVLLCPGAATSRWLGLGADAVAALGVRLVSVDRPGLGASTPAPGRRFGDFADDIRHLAALRGLGRPAMIGTHKAHHSRSHAPRKESRGHWPSCPARTRSPRRNSPTTPSWPWDGGRSILR